MRRLFWITFALTIAGLIFWVYLYLFGWTKRSHIAGDVTRLQFFENPAVLAVHVDSPRGVFVVPQIPPEHAAKLRAFVDPASIDLEFIYLNATTMHDQWSDTTRHEDILSLGVHGDARGDAKPTYGNRLAIGTGQDDYPYGTFKWMTEEEFAEMPLGTTFTDVKIYGKLGFGNYYHRGFRKKPFIIP
ncbi:MAG: hypothetical protein EOP83_00940 [Verrucomicrobiaceae bacterium]|nr:MAG: hypothetical protein EOP83_00940 [Verrucomicrobiaceae bacterium]